MMIRVESPAEHVPRRSRLPSPGITALVLLLGLSGCANLTSGADPRERGVDGAPCEGLVADAVDGLTGSSNASLLAKAQQPTGKGGVCSAKVFAVTEPVGLYRVFDGSNPHSKFGSWWSLKQPGSSRQAYRAENAICPEWSNLDRLVHCEVHPGTQIVLGTTQSASCADGSQFPRTPVIQVFVPNDGRAGIIHVGKCTEATIWP